MEVQREQEVADQPDVQDNVEGIYGQMRMCGYLDEMDWAVCEEPALGKFPEQRSIDLPAMMAYGMDAFGRDGFVREAGDPHILALEALGNLLTTSHTGNSFGLYRTDRSHIPACSNP